MADVSESPTSSGVPSDTPDARRSRRATAGTPRWVKVFVIAFIILVVVFVILHLTGNSFGDHMHMSGIERGVQSL